jgi:pimeloyl-ACP methyl ester carboxylesterase
VSQGVGDPFPHRPDEHLLHRRPVQPHSADHQNCAQAPQTVAHALADSPVGLLGWNVQLLDGLDDEFVLANTAIYWFTGTSGSSMRLYYEAAKSTEHPTTPTTVPIGLAGSTSDFLSIRRFAERDHANIVSWNVYEAPGHYTAHERPGVLVEDIRQFFGKVLEDNDDNVATLLHYLGRRPDWTRL